MDTVTPVGDQDTMISNILLLTLESLWILELESRGNYVIGLLRHSNDDIALNCHGNDVIAVDCHGNDVIDVTINAEEFSLVLPRKCRYNTDADLCPN